MGKKGLVVLGLPFPHLLITPGPLYCRLLPLGLQSVVPSLQVFVSVQEDGGISHLSSISTCFVVVGADGATQPVETIRRVVRESWVLKSHRKIPILLLRLSIC